jgi:anthranilate synthase component 2
VAVLLIDNYDSFTHNLYQLIGALGAEVRVVRNDAMTIEEIAAMGPSHIVLSPGPGHPGNERDFGVCGAVLDRLAATVPTLGVCLGHQGLAHRLGGTVVRAPEIVHGKTSVIRHDGTGVFAGLPAEIEVMRYHSLTVEVASVPDVLVCNATTTDGAVIMGLRHREWPLHGLQFHPESIGTPDGTALLRTFLEFS